MATDLDNPNSLRSALRSFLCIGPPQPAPTVSVLDSSSVEGYTRHVLHLATHDDTIPALLAVPNGPGPFPGVVVLHQHAGQRHFGKSEVFGLVGDPHQAFGPALARAGFIVLAPDSIAFEDRRPGGPGTDPRDDDWNQHYNALAFRLVNGDTLMRKVVEDAMAAVTVLAERPDVRANAIAILGHSYGGTTALFTTAVDERIAFGGASGALTSYRRRIAAGTSFEMAQVIPGFAARFDLEHVLGAIAPRRFLVVSGTHDEYAADADELVALACQAGDSVRAALQHLRAEGGHALEQERFDAIVNWMSDTASS